MPLELLKGSSKPVDADPSEDWRDNDDGALAGLEGPASPLSDGGGGGGGCLFLSDPFILGMPDEWDCLLDARDDGRSLFRFIVSITLLATF